MRAFVRTSVAVPVTAVADPAENARRTIALWQQAHDDGTAVVVFPELGLSSYTARDLFFDDTMAAAVDRALQTLLEASGDLSPLALVGAPLRTPRGTYNVAIAIQHGRILGCVPKSYLPNYREFEEKRWFREGREVKAGSTATVLGADVPFGTDILLWARDHNDDGGAVRDDVVVGVEVCEDYWVQVPPSALLVGAGASIVCNLSASNFTVGKADLRRLLGQSQSDRGKCAYLYVAAGPGESSTDLAFDADAFVCENGALLAESVRFSRTPQLVTVDVDVELLRHERQQTMSFGDCAAQHPIAVRHIPFVLPPASTTTGLRRVVPAHPFIPKDPATLATRAWEIFEIQTNALATRLQALTTDTWKPKLVLGISGGLDSTQAALVAATALDLCGRPRTDLIGVTMPGLGTSSGTKDNAVALATALGATVRTISVADMSRVVLGAVGHRAAVVDDDNGDKRNDGGGGNNVVQSVEALIDRVRAHPELGDATLENVQARLRTLVLMTIANQDGGLVVGTGDLSEKALGWATYAGDHISMYDVNAGVPKTLIQFVIRWVANERVSTWTTGDAARLRETLFSILDTPISPELLPTDADGAIAHLTEERIGPYELHDFFLFHLVRHGRRPGRILDLAQQAFQDRYDDVTLVRWLTVFLKRFFSNQFKRSCTADAPKVGLVALSPRGDWRMPSDARVQAWLDDVEAWRSSLPRRGA
jgi:NAD+ synthase (glutamine-hydrolysing)